MPRHQLTLAAALLLSLLLHAAFMGAGESPSPRILLPDGDVLASRAVASVTRVRLVASPEGLTLPPSRGTAGTSPSQTAPQPAPEKTLAPSEPAPPGASRDPPGTPFASPLPKDTPPALPEAAASTPRFPVEPAPAFPLQITAELEARMGRINSSLRQTWRMEGLRYAIDMQAGKSPLRARLSSEGQIHPEGGLTPLRSVLTIGDRERTFTEYAPGRITLGTPGNSRMHPLPVVPQDLASLPFHLAVTFAGQPMTVFVSTGSGLYQTRFTLVAEETLRLPAGVVRTLHLAGEQFHPGLREMVQAYDIWLAPDHLNYPVKVRGHLPGGTPFDYRLLSLDIEGQRVLGPPQAP